MCKSQHKNKRPVETRRFTFAYDPLFKRFARSRPEARRPGLISLPGYEGEELLRTVLQCMLYGVITYLFSHIQSHLAIYLKVDPPDEP